MTYVGVELPDKRAEVAVLEVLRQQLAGKLVYLVNRKLRSLFAPRHDVFARRIVHHVVPAGVREGRGQTTLDSEKSRESNADRVGHLHFTQERLGHVAGLHPRRVSPHHRDGGPSAYPPRSSRAEKCVIPGVAKRLEGRQKLSASFQTVSKRL